jgi:hypothetical protein
MHPSTVFVKSLPANATVLDFGAGVGGLVSQKTWPDPKRPDLRMYAYSLEYHPSFESYDGYEIGDFDSRPPEFKDVEISAVVAKHVIEHLATPSRFLEWVAHRLSRNGRIYIEWPSEYSQQLPRAIEFTSQGIDIMISNFYDDNTHKIIPERQSVIEALKKQNFQIESDGYVKIPYFEEELLASLLEHDTSIGQEVARRNAFWSLTLWSQYVIAEIRD